MALKRDLMGESRNAENETWTPHALFVVQGTQQKVSRRSVAENGGEVLEVIPQLTRRLVDLALCHRYLEVRDIVDVAMRRDETGVLERLWPIC